MILFVGFALLAGLLLWTVTLARGPWLAKLALILTVPAYGLLVWHEVETWRGYPVSAGPPRGAQLVATYVREPEAIYLWAIPPAELEPRAYRLPYERSLHEAAAQAEGNARQGVRVGIRWGVREGVGRWIFYSLPPAIPAKESP